MYTYMRTCIYVYIHAMHIPTYVHRVVPLCTFYIPLEECLPIYVLKLRRMPGDWHWHLLYPTACCPQSQTADWWRHLANKFEFYLLIFSVAVRGIEVLCCAVVFTFLMCRWRVLLVMHYADFTFHDEPCSSPAAKGLSAFVAPGRSCAL